MIRLNKKTVGMTIATTLKKSPSLSQAQSWNSLKMEIKRRFLIKSIFIQKQCSARLAW